MAFIVSATTTWSCSDSEFTCHDGSFCLEMHQLCDGEPDCLDSSDESEKYCGTDLFQCIQFSH